jgi:hypothetical protein
VCNLNIIYESWSLEHGTVCDHATHDNISLIKRISLLKYLMCHRSHRGTTTFRIKVNLKVRFKAVLCYVSLVSVDIICEVTRGLFSETLPFAYFCGVGMITSVSSISAYECCKTSDYQPWRWRQFVPPKRWYLATHGVTTQKKNIYINKVIHSIDSSYSLILDGSIIL